MTQINETGIRGFLKWLAQEQPGIYAKAAPKIASDVPAAFTDYHQGGWRIAGKTHSQAIASLGYIGDTLPAIDVSAASLGQPITVNLSPSMLGTDFSNAPAPAAVDVATAADSGGASSGTTDLIGNIVKGISSLYLGKKQADIQQQVVNTQLQRAALGLPPLPQSLSQLGVPQVNVGLSSGTSTLVIGGGIAALIALVMLSGRRGSRR